MYFLIIDLSKRKIKTVNTNSKTSFKSCEGVGEQGAQSVVFENDDRVVFVGKNLSELFEIEGRYKNRKSYVNSKVISFEEAIYFLEKNKKNTLNIDDFLYF